MEQDTSSNDKIEDERGGEPTGADPDGTIERNPATEDDFTDESHTVEDTDAEVSDGKVVVPRKYIEKMVENAYTLAVETSGVPDLRADRLEVLDYKTFMETRHNITNVDFHEDGSVEITANGTAPDGRYGDIDSPIEVTIEYDPSGADGFGTAKPEARWDSTTEN